MLELRYSSVARGSEVIRSSFMSAYRSSRSGLVVVGRRIFLHARARQFLAS